MQAILNANELKPFTRALTCIARYGDEMIVHATSNSMTLSSKNMALSAYCSIKYSSTFFQKYRLGKRMDAPTRASTSTNNAHEITCQLLTKSLLSVLKHRNNEKSVEKCELMISEGGRGREEAGDDEDSFESRLLVILHCKHGVVKTHRLLLNTVTDHYVPRLMEVTLENKVVIRPRTAKEIIDHFPLAKGGKNDPQLIWRFSDEEVRVKTLENGVDSKGKIQLATELTVGDREFEHFDIYSVPTTIGFHLREFSATIALADALNVPLDIRFTEPSEPLYIHADADDCQLLFIISTFQARGEEPPSDDVRSTRAPSVAVAPPSNSRVALPSKKRERDEDNNPVEGSMRPGTAASGRSESRKSARVVSRADSGDASTSRLSQQGNAYSRGAASQSTPRPRTQITVRGTTNGLERLQPSQRDLPPPSQSQPLFLASQVSAADYAKIQSTGLGIENMDAEEFAAMLDGAGDIDDTDIDIGGLQLVPDSTRGSNERGNGPRERAAAVNVTGGVTQVLSNTACPSSETEEDEMDYDPQTLGDDNFKNFDDVGQDDSFGDLGPTQGPTPGSAGSAQTRGVSKSTMTTQTSKNDSQKEYRALFED